MRRLLALTFLLVPLALFAQSTLLPIFIGQVQTLTPPAIDALGRVVVFGAGLAPDGKLNTTADLYAATTDGSGVRRLTQYGSSTPASNQLGVHEVSFTPDGTRVAFAALVASSSLGGEQVHVFDLATSTDRTVAIDKGGCIQPMLACANCFFTCVNTPHISPDGAKVLYSVRRQNPFYAVNSDGTELTQLPIYSGILAPGPQRVISGNGRVVFTSSAPFGPTFAAAAYDVYTMDLAGGNVRNLTKFSDWNIFAQNATISADGSLIAFESNMQPSTGKSGETTHVWVVRWDGAGLRAITAGVTCLALNCPSPGGTSPSISGDGSLVAYLNRDYLGGYRAFVSRLDGTGASALVSFNSSTVNDPVLTDDATRLAFTIGPRGGGRGAIYTAKSDGTGVLPAYAPRAINNGGVTGLVLGAMPTPGSLFSAYGFNLAADTPVSATSFPLPTRLGGLSLLVNGAEAPLLAVTPWQINAQLPNVAAGQNQFQVRFSDAGTTPAMAAQVESASPAIVTLTYSNQVVAAVYDATTGQIVTPASPAHAGDIIEVFGTGLGPTNPTVAAGQPAPFPPATTAFPVQMTFNQTPSTVLFSGLAPGMAGVYQVNAVVPAGLKPGTYVLYWKVGSVTSSGYATIAVQ